MHNRSEYNLQLKALMQKIKKLEAKKFTIAEEDGTCRSGQLKLKECKANFVKIYAMYEEIADIKYDMAYTCATDEDEISQLIHEALEYYNKALDGLATIRAQYSPDLLEKIERVLWVIENTNDDSMELDAPASVDVDTAEVQPSEPMPSEPMPFAPQQVPQYQAPFMLFPVRVMPGAHFGHFTTPAFNPFNSGK